MGLFTHPFAQAMVCAWGFASWASMQRYFGIPTGWAMVLITLVQIPASLVLFKVSPAPEMRNVALFVLCGAVPNGIAIVSNVALLGQPGDVITKWLPVMATMMPVVALVCGYFLLGEPVTLRKACGIGFACYSIYLMCT